MHICRLDTKPDRVPRATVRAAHGKDADLLVGEFACRTASRDRAARSPRSSPSARSPPTSIFSGRIPTVTRSPSSTLSSGRNGIIWPSVSSAATLLPCAADNRGQKIHARRADEPGHEQVGRMIIEFERRSDLLDDAVMHDDDAIGHRHGFHLVVGDIDGGGLQLLVQRLDLGAHMYAQLGIEIGQAVRRTGTPSDRARWHGPWQRAGAGRRKADAAGAAGKRQGQAAWRHCRRGS